MAIQPNPTPKPDYSAAGVQRERRPVTVDTVADDVERAGVLTDYATTEDVTVAVESVVMPDGVDIGDALTWDGDEWTIVRDRDADGNHLMPVTEGIGIKLDDGSALSFGWKDLIGMVVPKTVPGAGTPTLAAFRGGNTRAHYFQANDLIDMAFHVPHDWAPGTDLFVHVHWGHNGTAISGSFVFDFYTTLAQGFSQTTFPAEKNVTLTVGSLAIETTPQYAHRTDEVQLTSDGGSATLIDTATLEVDSIIIVQGKMSTIPSISGGTTSPFIFTIDIHYQSIGAGTTLNKAPDFYTP